MPRISIQKPTDQPIGANRLLENLRQSLTSPDFRQFRFMVAFAKAGPLLRLSREIAAWTTARKSLRAIIGIDEQGTSKEALEFALANFSETFVAHVPGPFSPTFHPKLYLFSGPQRASLFVGSNNLTVGGTESNLESYLRIDLELPVDKVTLDEFEAAWDDALKVSNELTADLLLQLQRCNLVLPEAQTRKTRAAGSGTSTTGHPPTPAFPSIPLVPPSSIPAGTLPPRRQVPATTAPAQTAPPPAPASVTQALVIQIVPHHNGEVFLSKKAVDQDPAFFGWPFTGLSVPKRSNNPPYPQRVPDPVVDLKVFDDKGKLKVRHNPFNLNTVYYSTKSEIRITVPQDVVSNAPAYSILVMRESSTIDYEMDIYAPGSTAYNTYLARCNQTMPSGGNPRPRHFGWL